MSCLLKTIEPESGAKTPAIMLKMVVLPAPFGPMRALMLPSGISNDASCTARRPRNDLPMPRTSRSAIGRLLLFPAYDELGERGDGNHEQGRIQHEEVGADVAIAGAQYAPLHQVLVDGVEHPEPRGEAGEGAALPEIGGEEQRGPRQRRERPLGEETERFVEEAHVFLPRPRRPAIVGHIPCGRNMTTASSTRP